MGQSEPVLDWKDDVQVVRKAWPEVKDNRGHGLGSPKTLLGLALHHHDAGEGARAAAEVVLPLLIIRNRIGTAAMADTKSLQRNVQEDMDFIPLVVFHRISNPILRPSSIEHSRLLEDSNSLLFLPV